MGEYQLIHDLRETAGAGADQLFLVGAEVLRHWAEEAADEERRACRRIVENHLRTYLVGAAADPASLMASVIAKIDRRGLGFDR